MKRIPISTYRFQFHKDFPIVEALDLIPYLDEIGITDVYSSPLLKAKSGSMHGYDVVDHSCLNPEITDLNQFENFCLNLSNRKMGLIMDIVPNHMGIPDIGNRWWLDVLENGISSIYSDYFDIDWNGVNLASRKKLLVPFLGEPSGVVIENQQIQLVYNTSENFFFQYFDIHLPLDITTLSPFLKILQQNLLKSQSSSINNVNELNMALKQIPSRNVTELSQKMQRRTLIHEWKKKFSKIYPLIQEEMEQSLKQINGIQGDPTSFNTLDELLCNQAYRLVYWRTASDEINYRRFFDINNLISIRMEDPKVYEEVHSLIFKFIKERKITGLRIDHPDGLFDPTKYFSSLQQSARKLLNTEEEHPLYVIVEKILEQGERIFEQWLVDGTTGYEFLNQLNGVFVDTSNAEHFYSIYQAYAGAEPTGFHDMVIQCKKLILDNFFQSELNSLARELYSITSRLRKTRDYSFSQSKEALREILACFPVYRTYIGTDTSAPTVTEAQLISISAQAAKKNPLIENILVDAIADLLSCCSEDRHFVMKFQQMTGPLMAKGLEDTAFYRYFVLTSLNEVGGSPDQFGLSRDKFNEENIYRVKHCPHSLSTTSTHDTKRSEDLRARINALSEIPNEWEAAIYEWRLQNKAYKSQVEGVGFAPLPNEEYLIYQSLIGIWPFEATTASDEIVSRLQAYILKAIKEAKVHTSWTQPNEKFEQAHTNFIKSILSNDSFLESFSRFQSRVSVLGKWNSLGQTVLKLMSPGVPDIYQGTELWDFSLVDPDNRRPVDFALRKEMFRSLKQKNSRESI